MTCPLEIDFQNVVQLHGLLFIWVMWRLQTGYIYNLINVSVFDLFFRSRRSCITLFSKIQESYDRVEAAWYSLSLIAINIATLLNMLFEQTSDIVANFKYMGAEQVAEPFISHIKTTT